MKPQVVGRTRKYKNIADIGIRLVAVYVVDNLTSTYAEMTRHYLSATPLALPVA
jgi:hypothetical protein